ncbi:MAG: hypothetical protein KKF44_06100 [Nanoarchaeota archaeon]|nr:hypothetical protein [Nanoarchaeota archaeon]
MDLKKIEKKTFINALYQDGIFDFILGSVFFIIGIEFLTGADFLIPLGFIVLVIGWAVKKKIIEPRIGKVKFSAKRNRSIMHAVLVLVISVFFGMIFIFVANSGIGNIPIGAIIIPLNILVVFVLIAYFLGYDILYLYAFLLASGVAGFEILKSRAFTNPYFLIVPSGIIMLIGMIKFIRFMMKYPHPK